MTRTPVVSSNLVSIGYDSNSNTLEIEFHKSGIYQYSNVPKSTYLSLRAASSHGEYFDAYIKKGGYTFKKVG